MYHAPDIFPIIFGTAFVEVKNWRSCGRVIVCLGYVHVLPEVKNLPNNSKKKKWYTFFGLSN